jgi:hypothetical protein
LENVLIFFFVWILHNPRMLRVDQLSAQDFVGLSPADAAQLATRVLAHVGEQSRQIQSQAQASQNTSNG